MPRLSTVGIASLQVGEDVKQSIEDADGVEILEFDFTECFAALRAIQKANEENQKLIDEVASYANENGWDSIASMLLCPASNIEADAIGRLRFPAALRKMWSGGEVQDWLKDQSNQLRQKMATKDH